jgi:hypothetical protein
MEPLKGALATSSQRRRTETPCYIWRTFRPEGDCFRTACDGGARSLLPRPMTGRIAQMQLIHIQTGKDEEAECLVGELGVYAPRRKQVLVLIELQERSEADVLALLSAVEACLSAKGIPSVRLRFDGRRRRDCRCGRRRRAGAGRELLQLLSIFLPLGASTYHSAPNFLSPSPLV